MDKARFVVSCLESRRTKFTTPHLKLVAVRGGCRFPRDRELEADENQWSYVENFKMRLHPTAILEKNGLPLKGFLRHLSSCNSRLCDAMALVQTTSIYRKSLRFPTVPLWSHSKISPPINWLGSLPGIRRPSRTHSDAPKWVECHPTTIPSENGHCRGIDARKCGQGEVAFP